MTDFLVRAETWTFSILLALALALVVFTGPFMLNDGPAHLSMANFMLHVGDPAWPMLNRMYTLNPGYTPNLGGELILVGLLKLLPPLAAEQALQAICILSVPLAGWLLLRRISPDRGWLAVFLIPVAMQRMFYLGLYNFCLSTAGFFLCLWAYLLLRQRASTVRALLLALLLLLTLVCQAFGWIAAMTAIGAMALSTTVARQRRREPLAHWLRDVVWVGAAMLPGLGLFGMFLLQGASERGIEYGLSPLLRIRLLFWGDPLSTIGPATGLSAFLLTLTLLALVARQALAIHRAWPTLPLARRDLAVSLLSLPVAFLVLALVIPDHAGGAWTHFWRAEIFPFVGLVLAAAAVPEKRRVHAFAHALAAAGAVVALASALALQTLYTPKALAEFREADPLIGPHCTVAPIMFHQRFDTANTAQIGHKPMTHAASLFELTNDRVALYNYIARLSVYPVQFRPGFDPQELLFRWPPEQEQPEAQNIDFVNFERATQIPIDYVLVWGTPNPAQQNLREQLYGGVLQDFTLVHRSTTGQLELYQRNGQVGCEKPAR
jgi:hypothetical protein